MSLRRSSDHSALSATTCAVLFQRLKTRGVTLFHRWVTLETAALLFCPLHARRAVAVPLLWHRWHLPPEAVRPTGTLDLDILCLIAHRFYLPTRL